MRRTITLVLLGGLCASAMGCDESSESGAVTAAPEGAPAQADPGSAQSTGIAECDAYLAKLTQCGQMPPANIEQMRQGYRMAATNPVVKPQMAMTCTQAAAAVTCAAAPATPPAAQPAAAPPVAAAAPTPRPASNFGAIATLDNSTVFGLAINQPSAAAAQAAALRQCGNTNCKVGETFPAGHCVVVSTIDRNGKVGVAWGNEPDMAGAIKALIGVCQQHNLQCPVVASGCSDGVDAPSTIGGGTVFTAPPPPIAQFKPKPRPARRACQSDRDCPGNMQCVVYRCPGCNKCEPRGGPPLSGIGGTCIDGGDAQCRPGLKCRSDLNTCYQP